jgi:hypothetical protein
MDLDSFLQSQFGPKASEKISLRRYLYMSKQDLFLNDKGRKRFFPTDSIRSESV